MKGAWKFLESRRKDLINDLKILRDATQSAKDNAEWLQIRQCMFKLQHELEQIYEADRRLALKKMADHDLWTRKAANG